MDLYVPKKLFLSFFVVVFTVSFVKMSFAETVSGGGYTVQQVISPLGEMGSGNGYVLEQSGQPTGGVEFGNGYILSGVFGTSTQASTPPPPTTSTGGGGGYFIFPTQNATGTILITTASGTSLVTSVGSTCATRVTFSSPIDYGLPTNVVEDVKKLETFLNTYEKERLPVNGIYEKRDIAAVKRWQKKYKSYILEPMRLKEPTGTVYTLSQRQIERQTTKACGVPVVVTACPFFREYVSYGDRGDSVKKVQLFLNIVRGEKLPVSGVYGPLTREATKRFQRAYKKDIFSILKFSFISGNWNEATREKANKAIGCDILK